MSAMCIFWLSYETRIFERPYYSFNFGGDVILFKTFESLVSSMWFTIITMTSVGYGGIIASTPIGRFFAIVSALVGAFLLSLLVAIITDWFIMVENQQSAIHRMSKDSAAGNTVKSAF